MPACCARGGSTSCNPGSGSIRFIGRHRAAVVANGMVTIVCETPIELIQPLRVDERLQDTPNLVLIVAPPQTAQEAHLQNAVDMTVDPLPQTRLVARVGQEQPRHLHDIVSAQYEAGFSAGGIELGQF